MEVETWSGAVRFFFGAGSRTRRVSATDRIDDAHVFCGMNLAYPFVQRPLLQPRPGGRPQRPTVRRPG